MSYNTRRGGGGPYMGNSAASVGQRRSNMQQQQQIGKNFVQGGQLTQPIKPLLQMPPQQPPMQRQQVQPQNSSQQNMAQRQQQTLRQQQNLRQQAQQFLAQQQTPQPLMQQQTPPPIQQQQPAPQPLMQQQVQQQPPIQQQQPAPQQPQQFLAQQQTPQPLMQQQTPLPIQQQQPTQQQPHNDQQPTVKVEEKSAGPIPGLLDNSNGNETGGGDSEDGSERRFKRNKPYWMRKDGKINKKERLRRRNKRLRKILQPKNALMVLNELIGNAPYNMTENADTYEGTIFKCTVLVDGMEHIGVGKSKPLAKTAAAEAALKHMVLSKLKTTQSFESNLISAAGPATIAPPAAASPTDAAEVDGVDIKMEVDTEDNLGGISWSHVACYALHKLLSSWDEGSHLAEKLARSLSGSVATSGGSVTVSDDTKTFEKSSTNNSLNSFLQLAQAASGGSVTASDKTKTFEKRPAKKLPDAAQTMNPIMLLNQMYPNAIYEEICKTGHTPNVQFTVKCTVNGEPFFGKESTKKGARKMCAFAACRKILGIQYDPAFLEQHGFSEDAVCFVSAEPPPAPTLTETNSANL